MAEHSGDTQAAAKDPQDRGDYRAPVIEDLGQIHEVTRHHGKIASHGDSPQGKEHTGGSGSVSGPVG